MGKTFFLDKNTPILLYGENAFAQNSFLCLQRNGYDIRGMIDLKYDASSQNGGMLRVALQDLANLSYVKECIVIICIRNGRLHEEVADTLSRSGVEKIVYLPMRMRISLKCQEKFRTAYRYVQNFEYEKAGPIPYYEIEESPYIVIEREDKWISFWCPEKYIHSSTVKIINECVKDASQMCYHYADLAVGMHKPYIELFRWLEGDQKADVALYLDVMGRTEEQDRAKMLLDRQKVYEIYEKAFHYNMGFFTDSPTRAKWIETENVFSVIDGWHRIQYLYHKGYHEMPILVRPEEYALFLKLKEDE